MAEITVRDHRGRTMRTPEQIELDHQAAQLRSLGMTFAQIADRMGYSRTAAFKAVERALADIPRMATEELRNLELEKLDDLERRARNIMIQQHPKVSTSGKVVTDLNGAPVIDPDPTLKAIGTVLKVIEKRTKLLGLDAPTKVEATVSVYDGMGEVEKEIYERALALRALDSGVGDSQALPMAGQGETGTEA